MASRRVVPLSLLLFSASRLLAQEAEGLVRAAEAALGNDPGRAVELASRAVAAAPGSPAAAGLLGRAAAQAGQPELAVEHLGRALALGGENLQLELYFASALWETGRYEAAETAFRRATELAGSGPRAQLAEHQLGRLLLWLGRSAEAVPVLVQALERGPRAPDVALDLARALELVGDPRALAAFERAVALAPESPRARWGLAQALLAARRTAEAAVELALYRELYLREQEAVRSEGLARAALDRAWTLLRAGDNESAAVSFERLGDGAEALEGLARAESARGRHGEAVALLERAVRRYPEHPSLLRLLDQERLALLAREP